MQQGKNRDLETKIEFMIPKKEQVKKQEDKRVSTVIAIKSVCSANSIQIESNAIKEALLGVQEHNWQ